jgi:hypothetical protein
MSLPKLSMADRDDLCDEERQSLETTAAGLTPSQSEVVLATPGRPRTRMPDEYVTELRARDLSIPVAERGHAGCRSRQESADLE